MFQTLKKYLTKILIAIIAVLFMALTGLGYLYKESIQENGRLERDIETLEISIEQCRLDVLLVEADKKEVEDSFTNIQTAYDEIKVSFGDIESKLSSKKCRGSNDEKNIDVNVVDDIADTLRLLREASCLSNKDCERP